MKDKNLFIVGKIISEGALGLFGYLLIWNRTSISNFVFMAIGFLFLLSGVLSILGGIIKIWKNNLNEKK